MWRRMRNVDVAVVWRNSPAMIKMPMTSDKKPALIGQVAIGDGADASRCGQCAGPPPDFPALAIALIALIGAMASCCEAP